MELAYDALVEAFNNPPEDSSAMAFALLHKGKLVAEHYGVVHYTDMSDLENWPALGEMTDASTRFAQNSVRCDTNEPDPNHERMSR